MSDNGRKTRLRPRQVRAVSCLVNGSTMHETSELCNISERQLSRWVRDPSFQAEMYAVQLDVMSGISRRLVQLAGRAVETLDEVLSDKSMSAGIRVRAALGVMDTLLKFRELVDIENRLVKLEVENENRKTQEATR